jgi:hypothetical protein
MTNTHEATKMEEWQIEIELVTPAKAKDWLENHNHGNRPLKKSVALKYAEIMKAGKWVTSPDGIIFASTGRLLQGQHRLMAVVLSECEVNMFVVRGTSESIFSSLDRGATRTAADALSINKRLAEVSRLAVSICKSKSANNTVSDHTIMRASQILEGVHNELIAKCPGSTKIFSSAAFRLAACARMLSSGSTHREYVLQLYHDLVMSRLAVLPPIAQSLTASVLRSNTKSSGGTAQVDLLCRAWTVFDFEKKDLTVLRILEHKRQSIVDSVACAIAPNGII